VSTDDAESAWSETLTLEAGLLRAEDWIARAITLPDDPGRSHPAPVPHLRREFDLDDAPRRARLYVTSLGVHDVRLNGQRVGQDLLAPGWTSYRKRLLAETYDVTSMLIAGRNVVGARLADGWYRGRLGWPVGQDRCRYGDELGLVLQLEIETSRGPRMVASDASWRSSTAEIQSADLYDGSVIDLREGKTGWDLAGFDDSAWRPARVVDLDVHLIEPHMSAPVRVFAARPMSIVTTDRGVMLDSGQNLAGYVRLRVQGRAGQRVTVRHAEVLEADGSLHTRSLRSARATDEYILAEGLEVLLEPSFTFHGFRYAEVVTDAQVIDAEAVAISSALGARSSFDCSDARLNRLHENVLWSQRGNFVSVPTDCPQRDERLGWTGDAQVFAATACTLAHAEAFWESWLRDLELDQDDVLGVPSVVPDVSMTGPARFGRAGWADAATIVPWAVYESYGDEDVLRRHFTSMRRWVDSLVRRRTSGGLLEPSWQFGDWLDPAAPPERPWEAKADAGFIANAFFAHSARLLADAAALIEPGSGPAYRQLAESVATATWARWGDEVPATQTACAIALRFGIAPPADRPRVVDALAGLVETSGGRVSTGFLGTPLILPALADAGRYDLAYRMLLCDEPPSWLYQVKQGATTVWERWDAIRADGSIHPGTLAPVPGSGGDEEGQMLSFNHYAYGAVVDWMYRHVAGLAPDPSGPGYSVVRFAPRPADRVTWAKASVDSAFGRVAIDWRLEEAGFVADVILPMGTQGRFVPPCRAHSVVAVDGLPSSGERELLMTAGSHRVTVTEPLIATSIQRPEASSPTPGGVRRVPGRRTQSGR
jgi:alpha-L-rhamnosidase